MGKQINARNSGLRILKQILILPSYDILHSYFRYDELTGLLYWKLRPANRVKIGDEAGTIIGCYKYVDLDKQSFLVHRIIWKMKTGNEPPDYIDHADTNGINNRWINLRQATQNQNIANSLLSIANNSGYKGVGYCKRAKRWRARIMIDYKDIQIGMFDTKEQAALARKNFALAKLTEFARETL